ncbi:MAG TPA: RNA polymerase sigma factor SigM [Marmoricola sp.]|nr:RNA polymerase sigma factor SigM [Marmoricola sp.]
MSQATDRDLLAAHAAGDPQAFGELFARHRDRLWAVALRTTGDREDAADALQDAMVSAFRRAADFRGDAQVTSWLHRIVVNACLDLLRRKKVRRAQPLPDELESDTDRADLGATEETPEVAALQGDLRARLLAGLQRLPDEQRSAIVLVDVEGLSIDEAADVLQCAAGTVKSRCSRGRQRLAQMLGGSRADFEADDGTPGPSGTSKRVPTTTQEVSSRDRTR